MSQVMIRRMQKGSSGGGGIGSVLGTIAGAIGGAVIGGPAGALTGASVGGGLGGTAGGIAAPAKGPQVIQSSPMERRAQNTPAYESRSPILEQSLLALQDATPEQQQEYTEPLIKAYGLSLREDKKRGLV